MSTVASKKLPQCAKNGGELDVVFIGYGVLNVLGDRDIEWLYPNISQERWAEGGFTPSWKGQKTKRLFDAVKIGNGPTVENEKLRPPYRPFSCCLAILQFSLRSRFYWGSILECVCLA